MTVQTPTTDANSTKSAKINNLTPGMTAKDISNAIHVSLDIEIPENSIRINESGTEAFFEANSSDLAEIIESGLVIRKVKVIPMKCIKTKIFKLNVSVVKELAKVILYFSKLPQKKFLESAWENLFQFSINDKMRFQEEKLFAVIEVSDNEWEEVKQNKEKLLVQKEEVNFLEISEIFIFLI